MTRILFQGDSITDAGRSRTDDFNKGCGYATLVAASLGFDHPGEYEFLNRGVSGDRVTNLIERIKYDIINLEPDVMSILIGINDVWHEFSCKNGVSAPKYEMYYNLLIEEIKEALPNIKIMILEPFLLHGAGSAPYYDEFRAEAEKRAAAARRVAEKNGLVFVPLMELFDKAEEKMGAGYYTGDGVHPTHAGHELIKREWIKAFKKLDI